jgi:hypothetical protein
LSLLGEKRKAGKVQSPLLNLIVKQTLCREAFSEYNSIRKLSVIQCIYRKQPAEAEFFCSGVRESFVIILTAARPSVKKISGIGAMQDGYGVIRRGRHKKRLAGHRFAITEELGRRGDGTQRR